MSVCSFDLWKFLVFLCLFLQDIFVPLIVLTWTYSHRFENLSSIAEQKYADRFWQNGESFGQRKLLCVSWLSPGWVRIRWLSSLLLKIKKLKKRKKLRKLWFFAWEFGVFQCVYIYLPTATVTNQVLTVSMMFVWIFIAFFNALFSIHIFIDFSMQISSILLSLILDLHQRFLRSSKITAIA